MYESCINAQWRVNPNSRHSSTQLSKLIAYKMKLYLYRGVEIDRKLDYDIESYRFVSVTLNDSTQFQEHVITRRRISHKRYKRQFVSVLLTHLSIFFCFSFCFSFVFILILYFVYDVDNNNNSHNIILIVT